MLFVRVVMRVLIVVVFFYKIVVLYRVEYQSRIFFVCVVMRVVRVVVLDYIV